MRVKCITTRIIDLQMSKEINIDRFNVDYSDVVTESKEYQVYAVLVKGLSQYFLIYGNMQVVFVHSDCFEMIDKSIPNHWISSISFFNGIKHDLLGYELLVNDNMHYNKLIDNDVETVIEFLRMNEVL